MLLLFYSIAVALCQIPDTFIRVNTIDNSILQDMRYGTYHNFIGRPLIGYNRGECILTRQAAQQLAINQQEALNRGYSLKVWDCYRPTQAVNDMYEWSMNTDTTMQDEFYPNEIKTELYKHGYIAKKSGHSRGSTIDLTLVKLDEIEQEVYHIGDRLRSCYASDRFGDNSIDMGSGFDCFDEIAWTFNTKINEEQRNNRMMLLNIMQGFKNYEGEWWHFTLINEPFPNQYFDFDT